MKLTDELDWALVNSEYDWEMTLLMLPPAERLSREEEQFRRMNGGINFIVLMIVCAALFWLFTRHNEAFYSEADCEPTCEEVHQ